MPEPSRHSASSNGDSRPFLSDMGFPEDESVVGEPDKNQSLDQYEDRSSLSSDDDAQAGVKAIEAVSQTWSKWSLITAYFGIYLLAFVTSLEMQTTTNLTVYATSAFKVHSLVATVLVVQGVVNAVIKPPMAKIANVFGRLEAFTLCIFIYVIGYIQQAGSTNVQTFAAAQIFYSAGFTGLQILQQIFIADTSDLLNRALFSSIPDIPFLITVWVGSPIAQSILSRGLDKWRWGYGLWAIVLPVAFLPLAVALALNMRKAKKLHLLPPGPWKGQTVFGGLKNLWYELDFFGLLLLSAAIALILIPLTLAARAKSGWRNNSMIAMLVIGAVSLVAFGFWESSKKLAPRAFMPARLFTSRTVLAGYAIAFFYFAVFYTSVQPYFYSYLQVVHGTSIIAAGHITQTFSFTSTVTSIAIGFVIKYTHHYKYFIILGASIYLIGVGIMIRYRAQGSSIAQLVGTQIAIGIGGGLVNVPTQLGVQASVSHADVAAVTAIFLTILEIGGAVGNAISGAIWTAHLPKKLALYLPDAAKESAFLIFGNLTMATSYPMGSPERLAINRSYQETMDKLLIVAACFAIPLFPLSLLMRNYNLAKMDQKVRGNVIGQSAAREGSASPEVGDGELRSSNGAPKRGYKTFLDRFRKT